MLRVSSIGIAIILVAAISTGSNAEEASSAPAVCELHIWPTDQFAVTENLGGANLGLVGALVDEATRLKSPEGVKRQFETQLSPAVQEQIIRDLGPSDVLSIPQYRVVIEPAESQPKWTLDRMKSSDRISMTAPNCYAELAIISNQYFKQAIGTRLRTFIWYREFDAKGNLRAKILDTTATKAPDFPAKDEGTITASTASIRKAFRDNLLKLVRDKLKR